MLVSAVIGPLGFARRVALAWEAALFTAISSAGIISELETKLSLPRIARRYTLDTPETIRWMQLLLGTQTEFYLVPLQERLVVTGDPEDDYVLATARLSQADYLITGDKGLLRVGQYGGARIVTPREFIETLGL